MHKHAVIIVGAGPTGLMLAGELALAGIDVAIVEKRLNQEVDGSRAGGLHARTLEILDQRGIADRFIAEGKKAQVAGFAWNPLDISDFPTRHNYGLSLWQRHIERILAGWVEALGVPVHRGAEVTSLIQHDVGMAITLADGQSIHADYLVGCDGGSSFVRKAAGIAFPGTDASISNLIAEVQFADEPAWGLRRDALGIHGISRLEEDGCIRTMVTEQLPAPSGKPDLATLREALVAVYGTDFGVHSPTWISRFTDMARQAETYRKGRILLAGDAAHVHYPVGGQGLNIGVQDAVNLGWKLAQVIRGVSPQSLLDTYQAERHPVAARVLQTTIAQVELLRRATPHNEALRDIVSGLMKMEEPRKQLAGMMSGLDIHYDLGEGHPLLGRRMPDLDLVVDDCPSRLFHLLHEALPVLLAFNEHRPRGLAHWGSRVQRVHARYNGPWELPVLGPVAAPPAVLIRPDGYVAWAGDDGEARLQEALSLWFGAIDEA